MMAAGYPQKQAVAASLSNARRHPSKRAEGGLAAYESDGEGTQDDGYAVGGAIGAEPHFASGFLHSKIPGRTDRLAISVPAGAHVIPADVVSALGQGNSLAGADVLEKAMAHASQAFAQGGSIHRGSSGKAGSRGKGRKSHARILAAGGEFVISPDEVAAVGGGNQKKGHDLLDKMIVRVRKWAAHKMLKLPGPKK